MNDWSMLKKLIWLHIVKGGGGIERTVKGAIVHVTNALARPAISVKCEVNPIQDLHGYDSPWPAGGGKNLWDYSGVVSGTNFSIILNSDNSVTITGTPDSNYQNLTEKIDITNALEDGEQYTLWMSSYTDLNNICYPQIVGERADTTKTYITANGRDKTFQVDKSTFVKYTIYLTAGSIANWGASRTITEFLQLEKGSSKTSFAPYSNICPISGRTSATIYRSGADTSNPTTYTIQLGDTVYGGQLDVTQGKMVVDRAIVDLGTLTWRMARTNTSGSNRFKATVNGIKLAESPSLIGNIVCSSYPAKSGNNTYTRIVGVAVEASQNEISVYDAISQEYTVEQFKNYVSGVQLVYELATPIEITLTPTQIEMLLGENNLWADAGDSTLTYYADGNASTSEALGILLGGTYNNPGGADDVSDDEALEILLGGS